MRKPNELDPDQWHTITTGGLRTGFESGKWVRVSYTFTVEDETFFESGSGDDVGMFYIQIQGNTTLPFSIKKPKLEYGNKPTDWTPAPEDTENEITEAIDKQTRNISSQIQQTADQITQTVSETYATKDSVQETVSASTELLSDSFTVRLEKLQEKRTLIQPAQRKPGNSSKPYPNTCGTATGCWSWETPAVPSYCSTKTTVYNLCCLTGLCNRCGRQPHGS